MLTRFTFNRLLNIQHTNGHFEYNDLPTILKNSIKDKHQNDKLVLNRKNYKLYYKSKRYRMMVPCDLN